MPDDEIPNEVREAIEEERQVAELETRIERSWAIRLQALLERRPPGIVVLAGLLLLALIGLIDAVSGGFAVEVFYLVPIGLVAFGRGRWMGLLLSGLAAIAWTAVEVFQQVTFLESSVTYWNTLTRFYGYAAVALLISPMREAMVMQRQLAEREAEAAEQLRAMNELREAALHSGIEEVEPTLVVAASLDPQPVAIEAEPAATDIDVRSQPTDPPPRVLDLEGGGDLLDALSDLERDARRARRSPSNP